MQNTFTNNITCYLTTNHPKLHCTFKILSVFPPHFQDFEELSKVSFWAYLVALIWTGAYDLSGNSKTKRILCSFSILWGIPHLQAKFLQSRHFQKGTNWIFDFHWLTWISRCVFVFQWPWSGCWAPRHFLWVCFDPFRSRWCRSTDIWQVLLLNSTFLQP